MSRVVYYAATSADGFIADRDGGVAWLDRFNAPELGYEEFLARVGAVVLGRVTYQQSLGFGPWPYAGRRGLIVTSRPLANLPDGVSCVAAESLPEALRALRASTEGDVWIVGGARTASACLEVVDELEIYVVPHLLGDGIPLLSRRDSALPLRLVETRAFENGVVKLRWSIEAASRGTPLPSA